MTDAFDRLHRKFVALARQGEARQRRLNGAVAAFRRKHHDLDAVLPALLNLLRTGAVETTDDPAINLARAYRAAKRREGTDA